MREEVCGVRGGRAAVNFLLGCICCTYLVRLQCAHGCCNLCAMSGRVAAVCLPYTFGLQQSQRVQTPTSESSPNCAAFRIRLVALGVGVS